MSEEAMEKPKGITRRKTRSRTQIISFEGPIAPSVEDVVSGLYKVTVAGREETECLKHLQNNLTNVQERMFCFNNLLKMFNGISGEKEEKPTADAPCDTRIKDIVMERKRIFEPVGSVARGGQ